MRKHRSLTTWDWSAAAAGVVAMAAIVIGQNSMPAPMKCPTAPGTACAGATQPSCQSPDGPCCCRIPGPGASCSCQSQDTCTNDQRCSVNDQD